MTAARKYHEVAHCEICRRPFPASALTRGLCEACAARPKTPPPVDLYELDDGEKQVERVCKDCGAHFIGSRLARYCPECRARHDAETRRKQYEAKRAARGKPRPTSRHCLRCGKEIDTAHKYCAECAAARIVESRRAFTAAHKDEINARQRANYAARKAARKGQPCTE